MSDAYDMIDRFLRNNLGSDDDYAEYSKALDSLCGAQPAQAVPASCGECGKKTSDGWALYCVACMEMAGLPAQAVPVLTDAEIHAADPIPQNRFDQERVEFARAVEAAVRAKMGVAVPKLTDEEIDTVQAVTNASYYAGTLKDRDHSRAIERLVRSKLGIVGKEGA